MKKSISSGSSSSGGNNNNNMHGSRPAAQPGCFNGALAMKGWEGVECTGADALPAESKPLPVKAEGQRAWERKVFPSNERLERRAAKAAGGGLA